VTLRRRLRLASGRRATALDIQRRYLERARAHLDALPPWAGAVCDIWQETLDRLARGPSAVADRLDWAIKLAIYRDRAARTGRPWPATLPRRLAPDAGPPPHAVAWRAELCELDVRFAQVYPRGGLFDTLDAAGVLRHRVEGVGDIERAVSVPPAEGRARIRGDVVARLATHGSWLLCGWDRIRDPLARRELDLSDPFAERESWRELPGDRATADWLVSCLVRDVRRPASPEAAESIRRLAEHLSASGDRALVRSGQHAIDVNNCGFELRNAGRLEEAECLMRAALAIDLAVRPPNHPKLLHRRNNLAVVLLMQGRPAEAREQARLAWEQVETDARYDLTTARLLTTRLILDLIDGVPCADVIGLLKSHLAIQPLPDYADVDRRWQVAPVFTVLASLVDPDRLALLEALSRVLNRQRPVESLDELPAWRDAPEVPLESPRPL
jgi:hypothetical protein